MDNFGGISKIGLVLAKNIDSVNINGLTASPILKSGATWREFKPGQYGSTVKVEPQTSEAGTLYNVTATIRIPFQNTDDEGWLYLYSLSKYGMSLKYLTLSGNWFIVGSKRFPLHMILEELNSSSPGSGYNGWQLTISGKQLNPQLKIV